MFLPWISAGIGSGIAFHLAFTPVGQAQATTAVQTISGQTAQGTYDSTVYEIKLGSTQGVNLSFLKMGETITRIWLDDPSRVVIDFDGCLTSAGAGNTGSNGCGAANGARLIHIRQLRTAIELPEEMSTGEGHFSMLTILTDAGKLYQFRLVLNWGNPPYSLVEVIPPPPPAPAQLQTVSDEIRTRILSQLEAGLAQAQLKGLVDTSSQAYNQALNLIALLRNGTRFEDAMTQSGAPRTLIDRLRALGNPSPTSNLPPTSSRAAPPQRSAPTPQSMPAR